MFKSKNVSVYEKERVIAASSTETQTQCAEGGHESSSP